MPPQPTDIVERIRSLRYVHVPVASELMAEAASAIESLRRRLTVRENIIGRLVSENQRLRDGAVTGCETVCPHVRGTVTQHCSLNFTLTDEEREAIEWFAEVRKPLTRLTQSHNREKYKDTLRGLLERTNHDAVPAARAINGSCGTGNTLTLTDVEREAVAGAADLLIGSKPGAALRNLLERLHT